jgi:tRNA(Ile)-lysidine synthetase-like protein
VAGVAGLSPRRWEWQHEPCLELPEIGARLLADIVPVPSEERIRRHPATVEYYDVAAVPSVLEVRGWLAGDRIRAFGSDEPRKLQDLFVNCGIARGQRRSLPIVCAGGEIIWVAGVRRAEFARLAVPRPATVLCLRCLRPGQPRQPRRQARPGARSTQRSRSR